MKRGHYLVFYVILGIGLVLSWGQVGKRVRQAPDAAARVMQTEDDCRPLRAPCAAFAKRFALVLGPAGDGRALRLVGERLPADVRLSARQYDDRARELSPPLLRAQGAARWRLRPAAEAVRIRVDLVSGEERWLAEFPLASRERRFR